ncbi:MAG TPA: IclR family transcriptional regulator [Burkholderiaceae bacterium]|nr:IclR family transcriptional regulator [Burkholderiaceae bacterium]
MTSPPAQTVARSVQMLRLIASSKTKNLRLVDLAEMASLDKSTAHRLLQRLVAERMLVRDAGQRGYRLGPLLYEFGLAALPSSNLREVAQPGLQALAKATGDMAFLVGRSGYESVCLARIAGNFAIQTMTQGVGDRHPLGIGAGGLAILAALSESDQAIVIQTISPQLKRYRLTSRALRARIDETLEQGFAIDEGSAAADVTAIGKVICDRAANPVGAVFVASIRSRMVESRKEEVEKRLAVCAANIQMSLRR